MNRESWPTGVLSFRWRRSAGLAIALAFLLAIPVWAQVNTEPSGNAAGTVVLVDGEARNAVGGTNPRPVKVGDIVHEGDILITGKASELHLVMLDTGFIALRPNTRFRILAYKANGGDDDTGVFRLLVGGFRSVTGWIGKFNARGYVVRTPTATIGIRGTDHEPRYIPDGSNEGEPGTYDRVYAGAAFIETPGGDATIAPNQAGFAAVHPQAKPRLLAEIPGFFKPGPHEAEINKKHAEIQQQIDRRREERSKAIAEKRAALEDAREKAQAVRAEQKATAEHVRQASQEQAKERLAKREALQRDTQALKERFETLKKKRADLQEVIKTGQITVPELQRRRKQLQDEAHAAGQALDELARRRKALGEEADAQLDDRYKTTEERLKAVHDQQLAARDKRKAVEAEIDSTVQELRTIQQQENKRYQEELKADRRQRSNSAVQSGGGTTR